MYGPIISDLLRTGAIAGLWYGHSGHWRDLSGADQPMRLGQSTASAQALTGTIYDWEYFDGVALNQVQAYDYHHKMMSVIGSQL
jgi:hypothetical protein